MFGWSDPSPYFRLKQHEGIAIVHLLGPEIRHADPALELGADLTRLYEQDNQKEILLNLSQIKYFSSTAFAVIMKLAEKMRASGGVMKICELRPEVAVGANIVGLTRLVETFADESEAIASF